VGGCVQKAVAELDVSDDCLVSLRASLRDLIQARISRLSPGGRLIVPAQTERTEQFDVQAICFLRVGVSEERLSGTGCTTESLHQVN
jgi:hypothetical protein